MRKHEGKQLLKKVIVFFNQKGGCGKTMSTMQVGGELANMGYEVFIMDMDPQNTAALWALQADAERPFPASVMSFAPLKTAFIEKLAGLSEKHDFVLIDCPPSIDSNVPWTALLVADFAVIPVIPVLDNVWASKQAEDLVIEARKQRAPGDSELGAAYLLSMIRRGKVFEMCEEELVKKASLPILKTKIAMRNVYPESQVFGCTPRVFGKSAAAAYTEVESATKEVLSMMGIQQPRSKG